LSEPRSASTARTPRVDELRVVSFGTFVAGNTPGLALADLGADVVKIEPRARPDVLRMPAYGFGDTNVVEPSGAPNTIMEADLARSMRNLSLDMEIETGRALFRRLVAVSDIVIENFGAHTMEHWGCSFDDLLRINPRLVMVSLSGYGRTGPRASYLAYATNISNFTGLTTVWGLQHGTHSDYIAAEHAAIAVLAAVAHSARTGVGVYIDVAQIETLAAVMAPLLLDPLNNGRDTVAPGNVVPGSWFSGVVACQGHDRWLAVELEDATDWAVLCEFLELPHLASAAPGDAAARQTLSDTLGAWARERSPHTAALLLQRAGLAAEAVADNEDVVRDPQVRARGAAVELDQPDLGVVEYYQSPYRLSKTPGCARRAGARLGQHTRAVLSEWLDVDDDELTALARSDAIFQAPEE
jgi:crotonobetainyl-CoA:carnitine CoA-transferase CaiB-like acyl-CoA transferase